MSNFNYNPTVFNPQKEIINWQKNYILKYYFKIRFITHTIILIRLISIEKHLIIYGED